MSRDELKAELGQLESYASINQRYHQKMIERWGRRDIIVKVCLAIFAVTSFALGLIGFWSLGASIVSAVLSFFSLSAAVSLTYFAFDSKERSHAESFARWTYLFQDVTTTEARLKSAGEAELIWLIDRFPELVGRISEIEKQELPPDRELMLEAQHDENEALWGAGIRTHEQVVAERDRRAAAAATVVQEPALLVS